MILYWDKKEDFDKVKSKLDNEEVLLASGDTVLGLYAQLNQNTYDRLNEIKQRSQMPYLVLIKSIDSVHCFVPKVSDKVQQLMKVCWPGPVTLILQARNDLPGYMKSKNGTIALRVPDHKGLQELLRNYNGLFSTSANLSSQPIPESIDQISLDILQEVGAVCLDRNITRYSLTASTILDCSGDEIKVVRQGTFSWDILKKSL